MDSIKEALIAEVERRIVEESIPRIIQCMGYLTNEEVWYQVNKNCNSIGVLVLHLCGNVRQWVLSGACGLADHRDRDKEFSPQLKPTIRELEQELQSLAADLKTHLPRIVSSQIFEIKPIQCYEETVFTMIIHAIEHFSYHTGQIVYITKSLRDIDTAFYAGQDLTAKG